MQPNGIRPVHIVQPSNVMQLNLRPTMITGNNQQFQTQSAPIYQMSTVRQPVMPQTITSVYGLQGQPRLATASPTYTSLQSPQLFTTNISPRPTTMTQPLARLPISTPPSMVTITRPGIAQVVTSPVVAPAPPPASTAAAGAKELVVRVPKTGSQYGIMEFANGITIDVKDWKSVEMRREINPYTYRAATNLDLAASSTATTITTSLGVVLPKTGAGSEYGREQKEALKRKRYATRGTNIEDLPWLLTDRSSSEKKARHYRGMKKGGVTTNSSYYVFIQGKDGFEAYPVEDWYGFTPVNVYKTMDFDEAEQKYQDRHKTLSKWMNTYAPKKSEDPEEANETVKGAKQVKKGKDGFKLLDTEEWTNENEEVDEDDEDDDGEDNDKKKSKGKKKKGKKSSTATGTNLSDDDDDNEEASRGAAKKRKADTQTTNERPGEDSDDGDHECDEIDYTSDETSDDEGDMKDVGTVKSSAKYEVKGVDEEVRTMPDMEKKLEQMDENADELDFDDDDDDIPEIEDHDEENGKNNGNDDLGDVGKLLKGDAIDREIESSSDDDDDLDDSDDPDREAIEPAASASNVQPIPLEQIKTEKGHKKAKEEEMRDIKSKVISLSTASSAASNSSETITEEKVRTLLQQKHHMTSSELIQKFLPKPEHLRTKEVKDGIVQKLASILKCLNIEEKMINGKKYIKLKG